MPSEQVAPKAVIFDVDGTLIDSVDLHAKAWVLAFQDYGHKVRFEKVRKQVGKGGDQLMPVFLSKEEIERIGKGLEARRGAILKERYLTRITAFPAVRELFQRLIADGKQIALASPTRARTARSSSETDLTCRSRGKSWFANDWLALRRMVRGRMETVRVHCGFQRPCRLAGALFSVAARR